MLPVYLDIIFIMSNICEGRETVLEHHGLASALILEKVEAVLPSRTDKSIVREEQYR